jgi:hypothetical protein
MIRALMVALLAQAAPAPATPEVLVPQDEVKQELTSFAYRSDKGKWFRCSI